MNARVDALNEHGTPVTVIDCTACGKQVTVCPAVDPEAWGEQCLTPDCSAYDITRDVDIWFDVAVEHRLIVRALVDGEGKEGGLWTTS